MLSVERYLVGALGTNCYLIKDIDTNIYAIVDPGGISKELSEKLKNIHVEYILLTHGHFDHIRKVDYYKNLTNAKVIICENEKDFLEDRTLNLSRIPLPKIKADKLVNDNDIIELGKTKLTVLSTPGHTKGSCCFLCDDCVFSGDTLMNGCIGRTDLATGNPSAMKTSLMKLFSILSNHKVYPGHGDPFIFSKDSEI